MGADFIILRHDLDDDPHVLRMAEDLGVDVAHVIDGLRRLWRHASLHSDDGVLVHASSYSIDKLTRVDGLARAAVLVGWLDLLIDRAVVPNFDEYLSVRALQKACVAFLKLHPVPVKLREDWPGFESFWGLYPKKKAKQEAIKVWNQIRPSPVMQAEMGQALVREKGSESWLKQGGKYIPHAARWLRGKRWRDEHEPHEPDGHVGQPGRVRARAGKYSQLSQGDALPQAQAPSGGQAPLFPGRPPGDEPHPTPPA